MRFEHALGDSKPQSMPISTSVLTTTVEWLENRFKLGFGHATPLIQHGQRQRFFLMVDAGLHRYTTASRRVADCVAHYVLQGTMQQLWLA